MIRRYILFFDPLLARDSTVLLFAVSGSLKKKPQVRLQMLRAFSNGFALEFGNGSGPQIAESSPLAERALAFSRKYATRVNLAAVTAMLSTPSRNWFFSSLQPDIQGTLQSKRMLSFDAKQMGTDVLVFPVSEQMKNAPIQSPGSISTLPGVAPDTFQSHEGVSNVG